MLEHLFSSRTRVKLLRLFLVSEDKSYFIREIGRKIKEHINSTRRELNNLEKIGLVKSYGQRRKKYYQVDKDFFLYPELKSLIFKAQVLMEKNFLKKIGRVGRIKYLALTGFFCGLSDTVTDILIVGSVNRRHLKNLIKHFQENFDHEIHYTVLSHKEFTYRHNMTDRFLYHILENKKIVVIDKLKEDAFQ
ncbi:MAG: winged helix-turn-helix domain-containing protein [Patescibacteria group bacterium]